MRRAAPVVLAVIATVLVLLTLRRGMPMSPDAWAYWQASVSLLEGAGFVDLFDLPVLEWPPGYPLFLAGTQGLFGVSAQSLCIATAILTGAGVLTTCWLLQWIAQRIKAETAQLVAAMVFVTIILVLNGRSVRAEAMLHVWLPLLLLAGLHARIATTSRHFWLSTLATVALGVLCVFTRYAALAFIPAVALLPFTNQHRGIWPRLAAAGIVCVSSLVVFLLLKHFVADPNRPIGFGHGRYGPLQYLGQLISGLDRNTNLSPLGAIVLLGSGVMLWRNKTHPAISRGVLLFVIATLAIMFVQFNLIPIADKLRGRFTVFATVFLVGAGILHLPHVRRRAVTSAILIATLAQPCLRMLNHGWQGRGAEVADYTDDALRRFAPKDALIHRDHTQRPPKQHGTTTLVSPPMYPWITERLRTR